MAPVVIGAVGALTSKLGKWLQQIPGITSEISVQRIATLGTATMLHSTLRLPGLWYRTQVLRSNTSVGIIYIFYIHSFFEYSFMKYFEDLNIEIDKNAHHYSSKSSKD